VAAEARQIAATVRARQRSVLGALQRALFRDAGEHRLGVNDHPACTVRGRAVSDRFANVTVAASMIDIGDAVARGVMPGPEVPGLVEIHVSVAGQHRTLDRDVKLPGAEEQGWARAVFGPQWEDAAYYAGHTARLRVVPVAHFSLFLTGARVPTGPPPQWVDHLRPLTGATPAST